MQRKTRLLLRAVRSTRRLATPWEEEHTDPAYSDSRHTFACIEPKLPRLVLNNITRYSLARPEEIHFAPEIRLLAHRFYTVAKHDVIVTPYNMAMACEEELWQIERGSKDKFGTAATNAAFLAFVYMIERWYPLTVFVTELHLDAFRTLYAYLGLKGRVAILCCDSPYICVGFKDPDDAFAYRISRENALLDGNPF